jgi:hypothetical protein
MTVLAAQGDVLIERLVALDAIRGPSEDCDGTSVIIARGEASGHAHRLQGSFVLYHDEALARDVPADLYLAHAHVRGPGARLIHDEHGPINLAEGTYRFRRQRCLDPMDNDFSDFFGICGD